MMPVVRSSAESKVSIAVFDAACGAPVIRRDTRTTIITYETAVFETELSVPVGASKDKTEDALAAWYKMIEAGVAVGQALAKEPTS
jgi:hypothetical protein